MHPPTMHCMLLYQHHILDMFMLFHVCLFHDSAMYAEVCSVVCDA